MGFFLPDQSSILNDWKPFMLFLHLYIVILKLMCQTKNEYIIFRVHQQFMNAPKEIFHKIICSDNITVFLKTFEKSVRYTLLFWVVELQKISRIEYSLIKLGYGFHNIYFPSSQALFTVLSISIYITTLKLYFRSSNISPI